MELDLLIQNPALEKEALRQSILKGLILCSFVFLATLPNEHSESPYAFHSDEMTQEWITFAPELADIAEEAKLPAPEADIAALLPAAPVEAPTPSKPSAQKNADLPKLSPKLLARIKHAKELMGRTYARISKKHNVESLQYVDEFVHAYVRRVLKKKWHGKADELARTILVESRKYDFDPIFLMAVIAQESGFKPTAKGPVGEIGLMQLRPSTAKWIAERHNLQYKGIKTLQNPIANVKLGAAYLNYLRDQMDAHGRLYLAAYNMGVSNVKRALNKSIWPKTYPSKVMKKYLRFYSELADQKDEKVTDKGHS